MDAMLALAVGSETETFWQRSGELVSMLYDGTVERSAARRFMVHLYLEHGSEEKVRKHVSDLPKDFLVDLACVAPKVTRDALTSDGCSYHCHKKGEQHCHFY